MEKCNDCKKIVDAPFGQCDDCFEKAMAQNGSVIYSLDNKREDENGKLSDME